jgi:hypothetical protein
LPEVTQGALEGFDFLLVGSLLAFGQLKSFENLVQVLERLLQGLCDLIYVINGLPNRGGRGRPSLARWRQGGRRLGSLRGNVGLGLCGKLLGLILVKVALGFELGFARKVA